MGNNTSAASNLQFNVVIDKQRAIHLLDLAEKSDYYLEDCHNSKTNSLARRDLTYGPNIIPTNDVKHALSYLEGSLTQLPLRLLADLKTVNIVQLMPSADGGMPHTRPGNIICYPNISQLFSKITLLHELWHIHQRIYGELWDKAFKELGWVQWNGILPEKIEESRRYNPDTIDIPLYIYEDKWVPVPIFRDIMHPKVNEVDIWFYNPEKGYHTKQIPPELQQYFPNLPAAAYEHPRELTAYILSEPSKYNTLSCFKNLISSIGEISIMNAENRYIY
jgi:hypothetical protein